MSRRKAPSWTLQEVAILREFFPGGGLDAVADMLPDRSWLSINTMASKLGIRSGRVSDAPAAKLQGDALEEAIRLREGKGWSFARIGATFGVSEAGASNAVLIALCPRKGFTPAQRDAQGRLLPEGLERLRLALRRGIKPVDIQLRLGLSAGRVAEERRRYAREIKAAGKVPLPPPGAGEAYSGRKIPAGQRQLVEQLLLQGLGAQKVSERSGVSRTHVLRARTRLIKRLARTGRCLPGCDRAGVRHVQAESARFVPDVLREALRTRILMGVPISRAALEVGIGGSSAYRIRDEIAAELAARGEAMPKPIRLGNKREVVERRKAQWLPKGARLIYRFRAILADLDFETAKARMIDELAAEHRAAADAAKPRTFEQQLAAVQAGARLVTVQHIRRAETVTIGGTSLA